MPQSPDLDDDSPAPYDEAKAIESEAAAMEAWKASDDTRLVREATTALVAAGMLDTVTDEMSDAVFLAVQKALEAAMPGMFNLTDTAEFREALEGIANGTIPIARHNPVRDAGRADAAGRDGAAGRGGDSSGVAAAADAALDGLDY